MIKNCEIIDNLQDFALSNGLSFVYSINYKENKFKIRFSNKYGIKTGNYSIDLNSEIDTVYIYDTITTDVSKIFNLEKENNNGL